MTSNRSNSVWLRWNSTLRKPVLAKSQAEVLNRKQDDDNTHGEIETGKRLGKPC